RYPSDRIAVRLVGLNCITRGDYRSSIDIARRSLEVDPDETQYQTMLGFFLEQSGYNDEGLEISARSLARDPTNLFAYHAVGHAYVARGDYRNALETFERAASLERYGHILWHLAEAQAILGHDRLTRDYSSAPTVPPFERIALMWRLEALRGARIDDMGGGSREQKDIFRDLYLELQRRLGNAEEVIELAQQRLLANPCHIQSLAALTWAYGRTGRPLLQRQAYQQLVNRAAEAGLE